MKKKFLSMLLALLIISGVISPTVLSVAAADVSVISDTTNTDGTPIISIEPVDVYSQKDESGDFNAKPDASGYAHFIIKATGKITEKITVHYATEDLSAIAKTGDYEANSGSVVLTNENTSVQISIKTNRTEYAVNVSNTNTYSSRSFKVKLTGVSGNAKISEEAKEAKCSLLSEHNLIAYIQGENTVLQAYTNEGSYWLHNFLTTDACDSGVTITKTRPLNFPSYWKADYVDGGIDAKLYVSLKDAIVDESWNNSSTGMTVEFLGINVFINGEFHETVFGWGPAFLYYKNGVVGDNDKFEDYYNENFHTLRWTHFWGTRTLGKEHFKYNLDDLIANNIIIRRPLYGPASSNANEPAEYFIGLSDDILNKTEIELKLTSHGGYSRQLLSGTVYFRLEDITAPKIETKENGSYAIYHNFDTVTKGDKLRVAIRFNEPVQVKGTEPFFIGKINGLGTGVEPNPYAIRFNYAGGSGTDTLYFESDYQGKYQINSITDIQFKYGDNIKDFAGIANSFSAISNWVINGFNIDKRTPIISIQNSDLKSSEWLTSKNIAVTVSNISDQATLYYSWTDENTAPTFENSISLNSISVNGTQDVVISSDGDGIKYLYIKVVSKYGQEQKYITLIDNGGKTVDRIGPFKCDNTAPIVDESQLLPKSKDEGSNMKTKKYSIPIPNDVSSKPIILKTYYVGTDGASYLLESKSHTFTENDSKNFEFELTAADVGISDNSTRREVTVFFTLEDKLGNIDEDVARHVVTFDTQDYINVGYAGPSSNYKDKTEFVDDGYIMIYNGDTQYQENGVFYSFEFDSIDHPSEGFIYLFMEKNGKPWEDANVEITEDIDYEAGKLIKMKIDFKSPLEEGYYDIYLGFFRGGLSDEDRINGRRPDYLSETYRVYVGTGKGKIDQLINNGTVFINKVYQIPTSSYFYYMDKNGTLGTVKNETYSGSRLAASFSSKEKALEYVMFNEYRDLYAVTLTAELADELNAGSFTVQKALGENTVAREGQVWIRYKSPTWNVGRSHDKSDWVFYYYGNSEAMVASRFSKLLSDTIKSISERIADQGRTVALTDFSLSGDGTGNSFVDKLGAPYLDPSQIFINDKRLSEQATNSQFITDIIYTGDLAIYSSNIIINSIDNYVLIGNSVIPAGVRLQYKRIDETGKESATWTEITYAEGQRFCDVLEGSGRYKIRELGDGGVSEYKIYIDSDAPRVLISWIDQNGGTLTQTLTKASEKEFRAKSLKIVGIDAREYDKYSYVAFYNTSKELYAVYWLTDLQHSSVDIPDGNYYMVVADRSGNTYTMTVYINSSNLNCEIKESENVKITFTCDRKESQIQDFYIKRNGVLLAGKYSPTMEFTESGTYEFYIRDIYGNVYGPEVYVFNRVYPEVTWKYRDETGFYVTYNGETKNKQFELGKIAEGSYVISTSTDLKFQLADGYGYAFVGVDPGHTKNPADNTVTIKNRQAFQLKIYYKKHPEVYTVYNCVVDTAPPLIDVSVQGITLIPDEIGELRGAIESGTAVISGNKLIPSKISYSSVETESRYIANNDMVLSDFIKVELYDEIGLSLAQVYLNGELIKEQSGESAGNDIVLDKSGAYQIVAEDALGNKSEFNFVNGTPDSFLYVVDGLPMKVGLHDFDKFDEDGNYTDSSFGNESVAFVIGEHMRIFYMITDADGGKHFVAFDVNDNAVREMYYCLDSKNKPILEISDTVLFDGKDKETAKDREYIIYEIKDIGLKIYAKVNTSGDTVLSILTTDTPSVTVDARLNTANEKFYYYTKTELSTASPSVTLKTTEDENPVEFTNGDDIIKLNHAFTIVTDNFDDNKVSYAEVYYSKKNDFAEMEYFWNDEIYSDGAYYDNEGFYLVRLVNQYGNESTFIVHVAGGFSITAYSEFADGTKNYYSSDYSKPLYSNEKIVFELYSDNVTITVKKDGADYKPVITVINGITNVVLSEDGNYTVILSDEHKNTIERSAEINCSSVAFNESLLIGYNENALKKKEGYTNQKLSINKSVFDEEQICYISVQYGDEITVIYDGISEEAISLDESKLFELIGNQGDGEYILRVRNRYGALLTKVLHYRSTPTLTLERVIRSSTEPEAYDISKALSIGFWSNSELIFKTDAESYVFTINGDKTECPKTLAFAAAEQQGRSEYEITYTDEYGFTYSFKAYLVRQTIEIKPELNNGGVDINGVITTLGDIVVKFSENSTCTYTVNNSEEKIYTPGEKLSMDGTYRFVVVDYAGNAAAMTVKKDTIVEFEFVNSNTLTAIQSGGVVNNAKVEFKSVNGDSVYIEKAFKDGVLQSDLSSTRFTGDGKWEFIISDKLGNKSYFCFYIITKEKSSFAYTTPYEYQITELWYDSGDGVKISYLKFANHSETSSSFEFSENGIYTVVMTSTVTGGVSKFEFTINTNAPTAYLVGCNLGETTLKDITVAGCVVGDTIRIYRFTSTGEELVSETEITSLSTKMPIVNEGGEYRIVVESEAGVETELSFVRKHVMNTAGSVFIITVIMVIVVGLFVGLVYRNKSRTDK